MTESPRITYQCAGRTFDRLFKERSLDETKNVVRKKLGLRQDTVVELAQLRDGKRIDLEDDEDFEALRALAKTSLHATVAVTIQKNGHSSSDPVSAPGEGRGYTSRSEPPYSPSMPQPVDTPRPRRKQKVTSNGDSVTSGSPQPSQQPAMKDVRPSSPREGPSTSVLKSTSEAVASPLSGPTTLPPAFQPENMGADLAADSAGTLRKKRKKRDSVPLGKEPSPEHGASNPGGVTMLPHTRKKRRKDQTAHSVIPNADSETPIGIRTGDAEPLRVLPAALATGDASLQASIEVTNPDMVKRTKTRRQKSEPERSVTKSKMCPVDQTEVMTPGLTKTLKRKASKKEVVDIDKTIVAFIAKKFQSDSSAFSDPVTAVDLEVPFADPPPKTKGKSNKAKPGAGMNSAIPTVAQRTPPNRMESIEASGAETRIIKGANGRTTESGQDSAVGPNITSGDPHGSQSGYKLGSATLTSCPACLGTVIHPLADCPVVQGGPDSIEACIAQMENDPGLAPSSGVIAALRRFAEKVRSIPSDSGNDSLSVEPSRVSVPPVAFYRESPRTGANPTIPKGHKISEVPVETYGEGSSSESSTEGEDEADNVAQQRTPVNASSRHLHLDDQLAPLIHGSAKRGPRRSVLDEIPSSSETENKSSSEDLVLDEDEDLSIQPSHKRTRKLSITRPSSIDPELTSGDEEDSLMPVYMDTSHEPLNHSQVPAIGETDDRVSINAEVKAAVRPEDDAYPREAGNQDHPISPQTGPSEIDATAPQSQSSTRIFEPASLKSDATAINVQAAKSPYLTSTERQTARVLVPSSSPVKDGTTANTETKAQSQDANDDVESVVEPSPDGDEESDPIEPEPTQPSGNTDPTPRRHQRRASRTALNPSPVSDQLSRRSGRLASRRSTVSNSGTTLVPLTQVRRRMSPAFENSVQPAREQNGVINDDAEEALLEKSVRKQVRKSRIKPIRSTTKRSDDSGDDTSPSVAREDGSPKRMTPSPSGQTKSNTLSVIDEPQTSSQGPLGGLSQRTSGAEKQKPSLSERDLLPSREKKGNTQPLFIPGSSQVPRAPSPSPSGSENESETAASLLPRKTPTNSTPRNSSQFRRLTDLTSNDTFFSKSKTAQQRFKNTPSVKVQPQFDASGDGEEDDESSSSSDDGAPSSHIPRDRRVGADTRRKGRGLSSLGDK